jgi:hypothetical protein
MARWTFTGQTTNPEKSWTTRDKTGLQLGLIEEAYRKVTNGIIPNDMLSIEPRLQSQLVKILLLLSHFLRPMENLQSSIRR